MDNQHLKDFEQILALHDWFYQYSDDYSVYSRGRRQQQSIESMHRSLRMMGLGEQADQLYNKYARAEA